MSLISFKYNNKNYTNWSPEEANAAGIPQDVIDAALSRQQEKENKTLIRNKISAEAGDVQSLMGTATDIGHFALYALAKIIYGIENANDLNDLKSSIIDFTDIAQSFLNDIENEAVKLPFREKGIDTVISEIKERATKTAQILGE